MYSICIWKSLYPLSGGRLSLSSSFVVYPQLTTQRDKSNSEKDFFFALSNLFIEFFLSPPLSRLFFYFFRSFLHFRCSLMCSFSIGCFCMYVFVLWRCKFFLYSLRVLFGECQIFTLSLVCVVVWFFLFGFKSFGLLFFFFVCFLCPSASCSSSSLRMYSMPNVLLNAFSLESSELYWEKRVRGKV